MVAPAGRAHPHQLPLHVASLKQNISYQTIREHDTHKVHCLYKYSIKSE